MQEELRQLLKNMLKEESVDYIMENYPSPQLLCDLSIDQLIKIPGVGVVKAKELNAACRFGMLILTAEDTQPVIRSGDDVYNLLKHISMLPEEHVFGLYLNTKNRVIAQTLISKGTINESLVHPRQFFANAVRLKAAAAICVHNHPSGQSMPSKEDLSITARLQEAGKILGIELLDHVIIGRNCYTSVKQKGMM